MSAKHQPPTLSLRRPSAERGLNPVRPPEPIVAPPTHPEPAPARPEPPEAPPAAAADPVVVTPPRPEPPPPATPAVIPPTTRPAPRASLSREVERLTREPESDFFVSIPQSKKTALKTYCVQNGISMRDWLLGILAEKGIGTDGSSKPNGSK